MSKYTSYREYLLNKVHYNATEDSIKDILLTNTRAANTAMMYLISLENSDNKMEDLSYSVLSRNRKGLSIYDFNGLYRIIKKVFKGRILTKDENARVRQLIPKYAGQIAYYLNRPQLIVREDPNVNE